MNLPIVQSSGGITLVGGGPFAASLLRLAIQRAPVVVAADGGADRCLALGVLPDAVVGDMDSLRPAARAAIPAERIHLIDEQDSTDFDKALRAVAAPFVLAVGFLGGRADHGLAVFNGLVRSPARCVLLGPRDVVFHAPLHLRLALRPGDRFSLFPMAPVRGESRGLHWPIDGIDFAPGGRIGTSNRVSAPGVEVRLSGPGMLCILPRARLGAALEALASG